MQWNETASDLVEEQLRQDVRQAYTQAQKLSQAIYLINRIQAFTAKARKQRYEKGITLLETSLQGLLAERPDLGKHAHVEKAKELLRELPL